MSKMLSYRVLIVNSFILFFFFCSSPITAQTPTPTSVPTTTPTVDICSDYLQQDCCRKLGGSSDDKNEGIISACLDFHEELYNLCCHTGGSGSSSGGVGTVGSSGSGSNTGGTGGSGTTGSVGTSGSGNTGSSGSSGTVGTSGGIGGGGSTGTTGEDPPPVSYIKACDGYDNRYLKTTLTMHSGIISGVVPVNVRLDACYCIVESGAPGCRGCTPNDPNALCDEGKARAIRNLDQSISAHLMDMTERSGAPVEITSGTQRVSPSELVREFNFDWDTKSSENKEYKLFGEVHFVSGPPLPSKNQVNVTVKNISNNSWIPNAPCKDVEVKYVGLFNKVISDGIQKICFDDKTKFFFPERCKTTGCIAFNSTPTDGMLDRSSRFISVNPATALCLGMDGTPREVHFNWNEGGNTESIKAEQCVFFEPDGSELRDSFFGSQGYYFIHLEALSKRRGPVTRNDPVEIPTTGEFCDELDPKCEIPKVCQNGTLPDRCYFSQTNPECLHPEERVGTCAKINPGTQIPISSDERLHLFDERSYPSGLGVPSPCWANVSVVCKGEPNNTEPWYGESPSQACRDAIRERNSTQCNICKSECISECMNPDTGPCVNEYLGFGDMCGACQYRCERSYAVCL